MTARSSGAGIPSARAQARAVDDPAPSDEILSAARAAMLAR
jgi:hypothetical protein